jgi:hypothetical protein
VPAVDRVALVKTDAEPPTGASDNGYPAEGV